MTATFTKESPSAPARFYDAEAAGLRWLAAAGPGSARVVKVLDVRDDKITLERLTPADPTRSAAEAFGRRLAVTHAAGASAFGQGPDGLAGDGFIGRQPLTLRPEPSWGRFFAEQRLLPYAVLACERGNLSEPGLRSVEQVCRRLAAGQFDDGRSPARIHGDLWTGNAFFVRDAAVLIDPAAHGGHGLTDIAMLDLFGAPYLRAITAAYAEAAELPDGWTGLVGLHQLHPLLVHAVSHGPAYGDAAARMARRYA
ncbi:MAG TPA: fructosamine kinase family protein [Propionibacteriaceae bacterium]